VKNFEQLWNELELKVANQVSGNTNNLVVSGVHEIGKKVLEEAGEVWLAAEYQSNQDLAIEISQLIYHLQVIAIARGLKLVDIYQEL
jgi:phosphoribosyl-ATP pyrophosphohydrolase